MARRTPAPAHVTPVTVAEAVTVVAPAAPATLDSVVAEVRDLATAVKALVGALTPMLTTGTVKSVAATPKIATAAKAKAAAPKALKHRAPAVGETIAVGDLVSIPVSALKGKCGEGLGGIITGTVLSLGTQVAKNRGDMPAGCAGTVLTIKLSPSRNVWAWVGDPRVSLTGKKIVEETVSA